MRVNLTWVGWVTVLMMETGCALHHGNFADAPLTFNTQMATDAAEKFAAYYPPASTALAMQHTANDSFGKVLLNSLRKQGYAVIEKALPDSSTPGIANAVPLRYIVDRLNTTRYFITIEIGRSSIARHYEQTGNRLVAAGYWVRKE